MDFSQPLPRSVRFSMNIDTFPGAENKTLVPSAAAGTAAGVAGATGGADASGRRAFEPMDPQLTSIQPGGGWILRLELAWGRLRRWYLRTFRPRFLVRMRNKRRGDFNGCPQEVLARADV